MTKSSLLQHCFYFLWAISRNSNLNATLDYNSWKLLCLLLRCALQIFRVKLQTLNFSYCSSYCFVFCFQYCHYNDSLWLLSFIQKTPIAKHTSIYIFILFSFLFLFGNIQSQFYVHHKQCNIRFFRNFYVLQKHISFLYLALYVPSGWGNYTTTTEFCV